MSTTLERPCGEYLTTSKTQELKKTPYAFDLSRERNLIRLHGEDYWDFFKSQTTYYLKETYGKVPTSIYEHEIREMPDGSMQLWFGKDAMARRARASYLTPVLDESLPDWYRERALKDVQWVDTLEMDLLKNAKEGQMFVDISPTPLNVSLQEKKKWAFKSHSFTRISQVVEEDGQKKLLTVVLRHYLAPQEQEVLFKELSGESVSHENLLGTVKKMRSDLSVGAIQQITRSLYDQTPIDRRVEIPDEDQVYRTEQEMNQIVNDMQNWLKGIFYMMLNGGSDIDIQSHFRGFEMAIKGIIEGEHINLENFKKLNVQDFSFSPIKEHAFLKDFMQRQYNFGGNDCGFGAGFGGNNRGLFNSSMADFGTRLQGLMLYPQGDTSYFKNLLNKEKDWDYHRGDCRVCESKNLEVGPCDICKTCEKTFD